MQELASIKLYYPDEVAQLLGMSTWTYMQKCLKREIPAKKIGRNWVITEEKLREYINKR